VENMKKTIAIAITALALTLSMGSMAFAQSSVDGYNSDDAVQNRIQSADDANTTSPSTAAKSGNDSSSLPFTGLDIALLAGAGGVLLGLGLGMRRLTRAPEAV
jgi:hypothetical protein